MPSQPEKKKRVLSGARPTGKLHLGNYVGAVSNWVKMQDQYECFFFVADWHALTTDYADTSKVKENSLEVLLDLLAAGLDPERCTLFIQSHVPQHAELYSAVLHDHAAGLAGARAHLQGAARKHHGKGFGHLWVSGLSRAAGRGHSDLPGGLRPRGRRSGAARRADAGNCAAVQSDSTPAAEMQSFPSRSRC